MIMERRSKISPPCSFLVFQIFHIAAKMEPLFPVFLTFMNSLSSHSSGIRLRLGNGQDKYVYLFQVSEQRAMIMTRMMQTFRLGKRHNLLLNMDLTGINLYHGSFPTTKCDMALKHKNCIGSNAFPKSQVYWAQGAEHAQCQIPAFSLVKNSSQEQARVARRARATYAHCCLSCCCFLGVSGDGLQARRFILVCQPAPSCCFSLLVLSVGRGTSGPSGKAVLGGSWR